MNKTNRFFKETFGKLNKNQLIIFLLSITIAGGFGLTQKLYAEEKRPKAIVQNQDQVVASTPRVVEAPVTSEAPKPTPKLEAQSTENPKPAAKPAPKPTPKPRQPQATAPSAAPKPNPQSQPTDSALTISGIFSQINQQRNANGLSSVSLSSSLNSAAGLKARHMSDNNYFAHTAPDGTTDFDFIQRVGYSYQAAGVNLAMGNFGSAKALVDAWMNSSGHRANILASFGREVGIGIYGKYFVMMIANPR